MILWDVVPFLPKFSFHFSFAASDFMLVVGPLSVLSGLVGLALSYALSVTNLLSGLITSFTQTETMMVSVERTEEYATEIPIEPQEELLQVRLCLARGYGAHWYIAYVDNQTCLCRVIQFFTVHVAQDVSAHIGSSPVSIGRNYFGRINKSCAFFFS